MAGRTKTDAAPDDALVVGSPSADPSPSEAPPARTFRLRDDLLDADGEPIVRLSFGCNPYVSVGAGETVTTDEESLAARLAGDERFDEVKA